ncbi:MAG: hypothetical protein V4850_17460 [Myxococcota bacterium]
MFLLNLIACDGDGDVKAAHARAEAFLNANPRGTAIVQVGVGGDTLTGVVGTRWNGEDLAAWLASCGAAVEGAADAELVLEPGAWPWDVDGEGLNPCLRERLGTFPFEEPSRRSERAVVRVRWRPAEVAEPTELAEGSGGPDVITLAPPYWRVSLGEEEPWGAGPAGLPSRLIIRPACTRDFVEGALEEAETWARQLTCTPGNTTPGDATPSGELHLVRTLLMFPDGRLDEVVTVPETPCIEARAWENQKWMSLQHVGGLALRDTRATMIVLDVPVGTW